jgi:hypothetical protein
VGFNAYKATLARKIYTLLTVPENKFDVLPAFKHGCMLVGALHFSTMFPCHGPQQLLGLP